MLSIFKQINDFIRINFFGRPYELNKLIYDNNIILSDEIEMNMVIKSCRNFYGWQNLSMLLSFSSIYPAYRVSKRKKLLKLKQLALLSFVLTPSILSYFYSYFSYWHLIRNLVLITREREKKYSTLKGNDIENFQLIFNRSKDLHKAIQSNVGFFQSITQILTP